MAQQYTSIHSGVDIDRAVSYYNSIDAYGRSVINCPISISNWNLVSSVTDNTDKENLNGVTAKYYIKITI